MVLRSRTWWCICQGLQTLIVPQPNSLEEPFNYDQASVEHIETTPRADVQRRVDAVSVFQPIAKRGAKSHQDRQAFTRASQQEEQEVSTVEWGEICKVAVIIASIAEGSPLPLAKATEWFQSDAARCVIRDTLRNVQEGDRRLRALEPPSMLPSPKTDEYSRVCAR